MFGKVSKITYAVALLLAIANQVSATYKSVTKSVSGDSYKYDMEFASDTCTNYYGVHVNVAIEAIDLAKLEVN